MKLFWQERRAGQRLILVLDDETEVEVGMVRSTAGGFDALAKTNTYDPGRAQKGLASMEEAKAFVEEFHPWDIFGGDLDLEVEPEAHPAQDRPEASTTPAEAPPGPADEPQAVDTSAEAPAVAAAETPRSVEPPAPVHEEPVAASDESSRKPGWKFWKKG